MDEQVTAAEAAARALGYRLEPVTVHHPRVGKTVQKWGFLRIGKAHPGEYWLKFGTPKLYESKQAALSALLARLDAPTPPTPHEEG